MGQGKVKTLPVAKGGDTHYGLVQIVPQSTDPVEVTLKATGLIDWTNDTHKVTIPARRSSLVFTFKTKSDAVTKPEKITATSDEYDFKTPARFEIHPK